MPPRLVLPAAASRSKERHGTALLDVCPACAIAYEEGITGIGLHLPAP